MQRFVWCLIGVALADPLIVDPIKTSGLKKVLLFVPGGKVPPADYLPMIRASQEKSQLSLSAAIIQCHINLCDALLEVPGLMRDAIDKMNQTMDGSLKSADIFISGHSLGGVGARHFLDKYQGAAGLALFGTLTNGDHEDLKGTLGYPLDLASFPVPLLAMTGELDMMPISHTADLVQQAKQFNNQKDQLSKLPVIVAGMDHSQFCPAFHVQNDIKAEISDEEATNSVSEILSAWLDYVTVGASSSVPVLQDWISKTEPIAAPFIAATELDRSWCSDAQKYLSASSQHFEVSTQERFSTASVESCHTSSSVDGDTVEAAVCSYRFYSYLNSTIPNYFPTYQGAKDISCKMVSEDRLAPLFNHSVPDMGSDEVKNRCSFLNKQAVEKASGIVESLWPTSMKRFQAQGKLITFKDDNQALTGPTWVLGGLSVDESDGEIVIQSKALISPVSSMIFPGNHYCKLLAPSKAVEILMTTGLTQRYGVSTDIVV